RLSFLVVIWYTLVVASSLLGRENSIGRPRSLSPPRTSYTSNPLRVKATAARQIGRIVSLKFILHQNLSRNRRVRQSSNLPPHHDRRRVSSQPRSLASPWQPHSRTWRARSL